MASFRLPTASQNSLANQLASLIDAGPAGGTIKIYTGPQPVDANTAISSQTLLALLTFADPSFGSAALGVITASGIAAVNAAASGAAAWARIADSNGNTIFDCDVGTGGSTIVLNTVGFSINAPVVINSFTITMPAGA